MSNKCCSPTQKIILAAQDRELTDLRTVRDIFFESAVADWWWRSWPSERMHLLEEFGVNDRRAMQLSGWHWRTLPGEVKAFLIQHALSGKPMEYLDQRDVTL